MANFGGLEPQDVLVLNAFCEEALAGNRLVLSGNAKRHPTGLSDAEWDESVQLLAEKGYIKKEAGYFSLPPRSLVAYVSRMPDYAERLDKLAKALCSVGSPAPGGGVFGANHKELAATLSEPENLVMVMIEDLQLRGLVQTLSTAGGLNVTSTTVTFRRQYCR